MEVQTDLSLVDISRSTSIDYTLLRYALSTSLPPNSPVPNQKEQTATWSSRGRPYVDKVPETKRCPNQRRQSESQTKRDPSTSRNANPSRVLIEPFSSTHDNNPENRNVMRPQLYKRRNSNPLREGYNDSKRLLPSSSNPNPLTENPQNSPIPSLLSLQLYPPVDVDEEFLYWLRRPSRRGCWNCGHPSRGYLECRHPLEESFCEQCGEKGCTTETCRVCAITKSALS